MPHRNSCSVAVSPSRVHWPVDISCARAHRVPAVQRLSSLYGGTYQLHRDLAANSQNIFRLQSVAAFLAHSCTLRVQVPSNPYAIEFMVAMPPRPDIVDGHPCAEAQGVPINSATLQVQVPAAQPGAPAGPVHLAANPSQRSQAGPHLPTWIPRFFARPATTTAAASLPVTNNPLAAGLSDPLRPSSQPSQQAPSTDPTPGDPAPATTAPSQVAGSGQEDLSDDAPPQGWRPHVAAGSAAGTPSSETFLAPQAARMDAAQSDALRDARWPAGPQETVVGLPVPGAHVPPAVTARAARR